MKLYIVALICLLISGLTMQSMAYETNAKEEKNFKLEPGGYISVVGDEGYITVESWDKNEVQLVINKRAWGRTKREAEELLKKIEIEISQTGNRLNIRQVNLYSEHRFSLWDVFDPDKWSRHHFEMNYEVDFDLKVPKEVGLRLQTDEGDITVSNILGDIDIRVDEGKMNLSNIEFNVMSLEIDEGDIECDHLISKKGRLVVEADEGNIRLQKCDVHKLKIHCDEGDILLRESRLYSSDISGDESDIRTDIIPETDGRHYIYTDEGDITIILPQQVDAEFRLETGEGRIDTAFDLQVTELEDGERVRGEIGNGNAKIEAYTDEGDISVQKK